MTKTDFDRLPPGWSLAVMQEAHISQVRKLETEVYEFPWSESIIRDCIQSAYYNRLLLTDTAHLVGYFVASIAVGECHILNICIKPEYRGRGMGRWLLRELLDGAADLGAEQAFLEARASNQPAITLYQQQGFQQIGLRKNYYPGNPGRENAMVMRLLLAQPG